MRSIAPVLLVAGIVLIVAAALAYTGLLSWFGRLPGDVRIQRENLRVYVPITSMLLLSGVLSLVIALIRRMR